MRREQAEVVAVVLTIDTVLILTILAIARALT